MVTAHWMTGGLARGARLALDAVLPPRCAACGAIVERQGGLCAECWPGLSLLGPPWCDCCGLPFAYDQGAGALCGACAGRRPEYDVARAALAYNDVARRLIVGFKHGDRTQHVPMLAAWLARTGAEVLAEADLVTCVPLHRTRLLARRFNQSALIASRLARSSGADFAPDLLVRRRATRSQGGLTRAQRFDNVRGAFALRPSRTGRVAGRRVVLVDDVVTTGATAEAAVRALKRGKPAHVALLALARVVRDTT